MDRTSVFRQSESHRKNYRKQKVHFFQALLQPDAPNLFCHFVAQSFLTKQLIEFNFVEFFILCRSPLNSAAFIKQNKITHASIY